MNIDAVVSAIQKKLGVTEDGLAGPETWKAIYNTVVGAPVPTTKGFSDKVDVRSELVIATLLPEVKTYARTLVQRAAAAGIEIKVIAGLRTYAEQDELFAQGRAKPGKRVTNAKGGESNHNFGVAFDVGVFEGNAYLDDSPAYDAVGAIGASIGLEWGGHWISLVDKPHFQLRPNWAKVMSESEMLAELSKRLENKAAVYG